MNNWDMTNKMWHALGKFQPMKVCEYIVSLVKTCVCMYIYMHLIIWYSIIYIYNYSIHIHTHIYIWNTSQQAIYCKASIIFQCKYPCSCLLLPGSSSFPTCEVGSLYRQQWIISTLGASWNPLQSYPTQPTPRRHVVPQWPTWGHGRTPLQPARNIRLNVPSVEETWQGNMIMHT